MTKLNQSPAQNSPALDDDDMLPEYDFSNGVRGKYAQTLREKGYSVTVHHEDGTSTTRYVSPVEVAEQQRQREEQREQHRQQQQPARSPVAHEEAAQWIGDRISGDKVAGDKVMGNKVQIGTVQGDAVAGNKIVNTQNLAQAAQDIKALLDQLAINYPGDDDFTRAGRAVGSIKNNPTVKQRVINAAKESGMAAFEKAVEAVTNNPAVSIVVAGVKGFVDAEG